MLFRSLELLLIWFVVHVDVCDVGVLALFVGLHVCVYFYVDCLRVIWYCLGGLWC